MKYIEYDLATGRILSQIRCESEPEVSEGVGLLMVDEDEEIDSIMYEVRRGNLVKTEETSQEILEREKLKREHQEKCRRRIRSMVSEYVIALIAEDEDEINNLKREFKKMKAYL